ncbi:MAG: rod-binding protein [Armatimonadetes bacterium]|nr:rod-binding protein [Armatimonadota bacterium]
MIEGINPQGIEKNIQQTQSKQKEEAKLKEVCQEFEALLINQVFSQMRKSIPKSDFFGKGQDQEMFNEMLDTERAQILAKTDSGIGLANILYQQMKDIVE